MPSAAVVIGIVLVILIGAGIAAYVVLSSGSSGSSGATAATTAAPITAVSPNPSNSAGSTTTTPTPTATLPAGVPGTTATPTATPTGGTPTATPTGGTPQKCCWNRWIQSCNTDGDCDTAPNASSAGPNGQLCVQSGAVTGQYGAAVCNTCAARGMVMNASSTGCALPAGTSSSGSGCFHQTVNGAQTSGTYACPTGIPVASGPLKDGTIIQANSPEYLRNSQIAAYDNSIPSYYYTPNGWVTGSATPPASGGTPYWFGAGISASNSDWNTNALVYP